MEANSRLGGRRFVAQAIARTSDAPGARCRQLIISPRNGTARTCSNSGRSNCRKLIGRSHRLAGCRSGPSSALRRVGCSRFHLDLRRRILARAHFLCCKVTEAALQESYNGAILVDGEWFCPQMPKRLVNATLTHKSIEEDKRTPADFELWMNQLQQRRAYVLRPNEKP